MFNRWEYWPLHAFYMPLYPWFGYLALRHLHPCFFSATNPGISAGGMGMESKYATLCKIDSRYLPTTLFLPADLPATTVIERIQQAGLRYPLIVKPDIGYRGMLVEKVYSQAELLAHVAPYSIDFLVQTYIDYPVEVGVYYHRYPDQTSGKITSLTLKKFLTVTGDGQHTVAQLMAQEDRARRQLPYFQQHAPDLLQEVLPAGETRQIGHIGNHARGTAFINGNPLIDAALTATIDRLAVPIEGFYCGRFDLRCASLTALKEGHSFSVIELNGVCGEPTHMYDAQTMTYPKALLTLARHWGIISKVARANRRRGITCVPPIPMLRLIAEWKRYIKVKIMGKK